MPRAHQALAGLPPACSQAPSGGTDLTTAPKSPPVAAYGCAAELVKCGISQVDRLAGEQRLLALPAVGNADKLVRMHAVGGLAMGQAMWSGSFIRLCLRWVNWNARLR